MSFNRTELRGIPTKNIVTNAILAKAGRITETNEMDALIKKTLDLSLFELAAELTEKQHYRWK